MLLHTIEYDYVGHKYSSVHNGMSRACDAGIVVALYDGNFEHSWTNTFY